MQTSERVLPVVGVGCQLLTAAEITEVTGLPVDPGQEGRLEALRKPSKEQ